MYRFMSRQMVLGAVASASCLFGMAMPATASFIVNGSFETAGNSATDPANWNTAGTTAGNTVERVNANASDGSFAVEMSAVGQTGIGTAAVLQQITNQATPAGDTPSAGTAYILSLDAKAVAFVGTNFNYQLGYFTDGVGVSNIAQGNKNDFTPGDPYQQLTLTADPAPAGVDGFFVQFTEAAGADPTLAGDLFVDNVTIQAVPEPASLAILGLGGLSLLGRRRRRA